MNIFKSLRLKNTGPFKQQTFNFKPGLSVIYGLNKSNARQSTNANGAGKSFFFSQISEILHDSPVVGEKADRIKKGERTLTFDIKGKEVAVTRKNTKLLVSVDGKPKKFRTQAICKSWVKKYVPLTAEDFNTYVHIDARIPHPLVMGTTTDRRRFFSSFFSLDKLDIERKLFQAELSKLSKVRAAYRELKNEYKITIEDGVGKDEYQAMKEKEELLTTKLRKLSKQNDKLQEIASIITFYEAAEDSIKRLMDMVGDELTVDSFEKKFEDVKWDYAKDTKDLEEALEYEEYLRDNRTYLKKYESLSKGTRKLLVELGYRKSLKKVEKSVERLDEINSALHLIRLKTLDMIGVRY
jgi:hypothetical protein